MPEDHQEVITLPESDNEIEEMVIIKFSRNTQQTRVGQGLKNQTYPFQKPILKPIEKEFEVPETDIDRIIQNTRKDGVSIFKKTTKTR